MRSIFLGTRLEALKVLCKYTDVKLIITEKNSFVNKYYKINKEKKILTNNLRKENLFRLISSQNVDLIFSAGFPYKIPVNKINKKILLVNSHPSLLPKNKGKYPIDQIFKSGSKTYGVTLHHIDKKLDNGKVILQKKIIIKFKKIDKVKKKLFSIVEPNLINKFLKSLNKCPN